ncbi:MAG: stage III sporulation protein AA [Firmicutes bacterium]|nr:stage III sporulation protein AA [Bacillota bacterium]MCL5039107.1 stage III sporulation protein AA [Bacillota bacterium]
MLYVEPGAAGATKQMGVFQRSPGAQPQFLLAEVLPFLPARIQRALLELSPEIQEAVEEIRLRRGRPAMIHYGHRDLVLVQGGEPVVVGESDITRTLQQVGDSSLYAYEEEIRNGFLTMRGGHRVGLVGQAVLEGGRVKTLRHLSGLNIRIVREFPGVARPVLPHLLAFDRWGNGRVMNGLIISPPQAGKTTLLRDLTRLLSSGAESLGWNGVKVGLVDERSEVAACYQGVPQRDVGMRTDVIDACPKAEGIMMLLRSMSPAVVVVDEIGRREDVLAVEEAINGGVAVLASAHGLGKDDLSRRPMLQGLLETAVFDRIIILSRRQGPGTLETILDGQTGKPVPGFTAASPAPFTADFFPGREKG